MNQNPVLVAVCGGTSTGKSTIVSQQLKKALGNEIVEIVELDNFQKGRESEQLFKGRYGHDTPEYFEVAECAKTIKLLINTKSAIIPVYDYKQGKQTGLNVIIPKPVVVIEGLFASFGELAELADMVVYVESPLYGRLLRRIFRNRYERYNAQPIISFTNFFSTLNTHNDLIVPQKKIANHVVCSSYGFVDSIKRFNLSPLECKENSVDLMYQFHISKSTMLGIYCSSNQKHFTLMHKNKCYLDFEISEDQYLKMKALDFNSL